VAATIVQYLGTGRRKRSVARVFLRPGKGEIKSTTARLRTTFPRKVRAPWCGSPCCHGNHGKVRHADSRGWRGVAGQAGAARLGISRALVEFNAELRSRLKKLGLLTRDPRQHERKKYGQKGARKRFQFSKR